MELERLAEQLGQVLSQKGWLLATAESCTGGWVAQTVTAIPGSSAWFDRGFVTYQNQAKQDMLGVSQKTLATYGAVSEQIAREMAEGALKNSQANIALSITGIAGPSGATADKPLGTVWFAWAFKDQPTTTQCQHFKGGRQDVRHQAVAFTLTEVVQLVTQSL